jgi:hypothetical protein
MDNRILECEHQRDVCTEEMESLDSRGLLTDRDRSRMRSVIEETHEQEQIFMIFKALAKK